MRFNSLILLLFATMSSIASGVDDVCISFSTKGPDLYADGTAVLDGECYALVWSEDGVFNGFTASGECVDTNDRIILVAPVAKNGRCPLVLFQIAATDASELSDGQYSIYLLDTRLSVGGTTKVCGLSKGKLALMNGYGQASADFNLAASQKNTPADKVDVLKSEVKVAVSAAVPHDCPQPKIKAMRIEGEYVFLSVENLKGYMRVSSGKNITASEVSSAAVEANGTDEDVTFVVPKCGQSGFLKVIRSNN